MFARFLFVCFVVGCAPVNRDDVDIKKNAKAQAEKIQTAIMKGDYGKVADLTHSKVVDGLGGKDKMIAKMAGGMEAMKEQGLEFKNLKILDPSDPVKAGKDLYIVVPHSLELAGGGKRLEVKGALVGISSDGGMTWVFVEATLGRETIKKLLPDLPNSLDIPRKQAPKVIDD